MRIGMVGTGSFARRGSLPAIKLASGVTLSAVYDPHSDSAREAARAFEGVTVCASLAELLTSPNVDVVFIGAPPQAHVELVSAVIEAGKPFICEKPVTLTHADAVHLANRANAAGLLNAVDHEFRYDAGIKAMRQLLSEGYVGEIRNSLLGVIVGLSVNPQYEALIYWCFHHSASMGGGVLPQLCSHLLDIHLHLFGDMAAVGGYMTNMVKERRMPPTVRGGEPGPLRAVEAEDSAALAGRLPNGAPATVSVSWGAPCMPELRWSIHGDAGTLVYEGNNGWFGGRLHGQRIGESKPKEIELPKVRLLECEMDRTRYQQDLIAELLMDFAEVLSGKKKFGTFATLQDDARVWRNIERWRFLSEMHTRE